MHQDVARNITQVSTFYCVVYTDYAPPGKHYIVDYTMAAASWLIRRIPRVKRFPFCAIDVGNFSAVR